MYEDNSKFYAELISPRGKISGCPFFQNLLYWMQLLERGRKNAKRCFFDVYTKFKLHFYKEIFQRFQTREASLTTVETFSMECIKALGNPTINEFASFMCISPPNAAYKVNSLIKKGYVRKVQSTVDRREFHLEVTQKYMDYYNLSANYMQDVMDRIFQN